MSINSDNNQAAAFSLFSQREKGVVPPTLAAHILGITIQGVYSAASRGRISYVKWRSVRYYGLASLHSYSYYHQKKSGHKYLENAPSEFIYDVDTKSLTRRNDISFSC